MIGKSLHARVVAGPMIAAGLAIALHAGLPAPVEGQSVVQRTPNLAGGWTGEAGQLHFNFLHRFEASPPPARRVSNVPTFLLGYSVGESGLAGIHYSTNSRLVPRLPNEWEVFGRFAPLSVEEGDALDAAATVAFNHAAESIDGELSVALPVGRWRTMAAARVFSSAYDEGDARVALGAGARLRLTRSIALAADLGSLLDRSEGERVAWGAGLQIEIPFTPHSLSLQAGNTGSGTLQGSSRGEVGTRYGFEFTLPISPSRYIRRGPRASDVEAGALTPAEREALEGFEEHVLVTPMRNMEYGMTRIVVPAGTTVVWVNRDPLMHTVTADDESWDSGPIEAGESWSRTFDEPGEFPFFCLPHPFMVGVVIVQ